MVLITTDICKYINLAMHCKITSSCKVTLKVLVTEENVGLLDISGGCITEFSLR